MTSERPHDQRFIERPMNGSVVEVTQMLLSYISARLYVVFLLKDERALEYLYLGSVACVCVRSSG